MPAAASGGVFISYRRQETSAMAGRLYDRLAARFGEDQVFMDVDTIALGVDFTEVITQAVSTCQVLLAIIGPTWLGATDQEGRRRLEDPEDIVRLEISAALERGIRVIPILVEGALMPRRQELPEALAGLARRNALILRHESFRADADRLLAAIEPILHAPPAGPTAPGPVPPVVVDPADLVPFPRTLQVMRHDMAVKGVAFSPDGRLLATASEDRAVRVWEVATGQERARVRHEDAVRAVVFSPDGSLLATASADGRARIWEVASRQERVQVTHGNAVEGWPSVLMGGCSPPQAPIIRRESGKYPAASSAPRSATTEQFTRWPSALMGGCWLPRALIGQRESGGCPADRSTSRLRTMTVLCWPLCSALMGGYWPLRALIGQRESGNCPRGEQRGSFGC